MLIASNLRSTDAPVAAEAAAGRRVLIADCDDSALDMLGAIDPADGGDDCCLLLESDTALRLLQTAGLPPHLHRRLDLIATTVEDLCAKSVLVRAPGVDNSVTALDRTPVTRESDTVVHLVIFGDSAAADALAINAALVAHYPNYCRDPRLRTRITIVADTAMAVRDRLVRRYRRLFENSYYRSIDLHLDDPRPALHVPEHLGRLGDFVDVEWEFVRGDSSAAAVRRKLAEWAGSPLRQLTVALCHPSHNRNIDEALDLPSEIHRGSTAVLCRTDAPAAARLACESGACPGLRPYGLQSASVGLLRTLKALGQHINYVYHHCFALPPEAPLAPPADIDTDRLAELWRGIGSLSKRYSNIFGAMTIGTKMHSLGHTDPERTESYYALSVDEIDTLTEVEHNRWSLEELMLGYRPVTAEEQRAVEADISLKRTLRDTERAHYDLRAYSDLRPDATGKPVEIYDRALTQAIPLIVQSCITGSKI